MHTSDSELSHTVQGFGIVPNASIGIQKRLGEVSFHFYLDPNALRYLNVPQIKIYMFQTYINLLKPTGHVMHQQLNIQQL